MKSLSAAEKQRQYRARRNADPERRAAYLQKHREIWHDNKQRGKVKGVKDLSEREKRRKQAYWRKAQRQSRERMKGIQSLFTPPQSPEDDPEPQMSRQRRARRRKVKKRESSVYRELQALKESLNHQKRKTEKYRKRLTRLHKNVGSPRSKTYHLLAGVPVPQEVHKTLVFHHALVENISKKYASTKNKKTRQLIATIVSGRILKKYKLKKKIQQTLVISRKQLKNHEIAISHTVKYKSLCHRLREEVVSFFTRDDSSRLTAGRSQTVTRGKIKKRKRFLNDTMRNLHRKFLLESPKSRISYSLFCRMRPFWVVHPSISDRETCLCKSHENLGFLVEKLHFLNIIGSTDLEEMAESICCIPKSKNCMYNICPECKDREFPVPTERDLESTVYFTQWMTETVLREKKNKEGVKEKVSHKMTVKKRMKMTLQHLLELFQKQLIHFKRHLFNIKSQFTFYRELKMKMTHQECLIHVDFSENYVCKYSSEIQAVHFASNQQQATLHTGVLHVGGQEEHVCFATIASSKEKGPAAIWTHLAPILDLVKASYPDVNTVHFLSDGPCTQYIQKGNFYLFCTQLHQYGFQSGTWNFFEASHGKGAPDGVGGLLKRTADRLVSHGEDIPTPEVLFNALVDAKLKMKLFYISDDNVAEAIKNMPECLPVVPSTLQIHQVVTVEQRKITYREVSSICSARQTLDCQCHPTKTFAFEATTPTQEHTNTQKQPEFAWKDAEVGKWCCLNYDHDIYPGIIQEISETHVEVKCMHRVGVNRFFWPAREDVLWYLHSDIITMIPPPTAVTSRHVEIDKEIWAKISDM